MHKINKSLMILTLVCSLTACDQENGQDTADNITTEAVARKPPGNDGTSGLVMFNCGEMGVKTFIEESAVSLSTNGNNYTLHRMETASGAKYQNEPEAEPQVTFWTKGDGALLVVGNEKYTDCKMVEVNRAIPEFYKASGTEPFWTVEFDAETITVNVMGKTPALYERPIPRVSVEDHIYHLEGDNKVTITPAPENKPCTDGMSDRFYPEKVELVFNEKTYYGCGGI